MSTKVSEFLRSHALGLLAIFIALGGSAMAAGYVPTAHKSVVTPRKFKALKARVAALETKLNSPVSGDLTGVYPNLKIKNTVLAAALDIPDGSITTNKLAEGAVTMSKLAVGAVGTSNLTAGAVGSTQIANESIGAIDIGPGAVNNSELADNAVNFPKLAADAVSGPKILDGGIGSADIGDGQVGPADIADRAVRYGKLDLQYLTASTAHTVAAGGDAAVFAPNCPSGGPITGGGFWTPNPFSAPPAKVAISENTVGPFGGWLVGASNTDSVSHDFTPQVVCDL
jgi:hypothetical protein